MRRLPDGLIVVGDAICSFIPVYGQGMTMAALDAVVLRDCLQDDHRHLPRRSYHDSAKNIAVAWRTAVGADLALPQVAGPRPISVRITNAFLARLMIAAQTETAVTEQFLRVVGMIDSPASLLRPVMMLRIAQAGARGHGHQQPSLTRSVQPSALSG
jgi:2-polyprenyl-6-methoxyphenol hydroxylase-like FAD-dependent oxidoreductase